MSNNQKPAPGATSSSPKAFDETKKQPGFEKEGQSQEGNRTEINKSTERGSAPETATKFSDSNKNNAA